MSLKYEPSPRQATHVETARQILHRAVTLKLRARQVCVLFFFDTLEWYKSL